MKIPCDGVDPSQGTHFFQNLTSFGVGYFTNNPFKGDGWLDESYLNALPAVVATDYLRLVHFKQPIVAKMDGLHSLGVVMKEAESSKLCFESSSNIL